MNCEQVEELLSAYLDNMLTSEERRLVATHLQSCSACSAILSDYSNYGTLIALLPRVSPEASLRERLFASPEFLETLESEALAGEEPLEWTLPPISRLPAKHPRRDTPGRPQLVAIPGGRSTQPTPSVQPTQHTARPRQQASHAARGSARGLRIMIATLAAALVLTLGIGGFIGFTILSHGSQLANGGGITPPSGPQGAGPLSAGARYVFLRGGTLWSELTDGSEKQPDRLTPTSALVAPGWVVSSPLPGRLAGDMLAYIDLQQARLHIIRSDGQEDTTVNQPLFKAGIAPASAWDTDTGRAILGSLAWSSDGSGLAFLADPAGTGRTSLYLYSTVTHKVTAVPTPTQGDAAYPTWSPDSSRLAFEVTQNGLTSIIDYNVQNHGVLAIAENVGSGSSAGDSVLALGWSPDVQEPSITWSVGAIGHVHSLWTRRVGIDANTGASLLLSGDYAQAIYSRNGRNDAGSWLVITSVAGQAGDLWRIDITSGSRFVQLASGRQVNFAQWSPDGASIDYLDSLSAGIGALRVVNATTASDRLIANGATNDPAPAWSADSQQIAFSTGTRVGIASLAAAAQGSSARYLALKGAASALMWSLTSSHQLIVAMNDGQQGIFLEDTQDGAAQQLDRLGADGPLLWTEIP
jgi:Putative zinc-finger/WD40-like Beta Propeller Repeat